MKSSKGLAFSALMSLALAALVLPRSLSAQAPTFTVLHSFTGPDGWYPQAGLIIDNSGNLYGTTVFGGTGTCPPLLGGFSGCGTMFKLDTSGNETLLQGSPAHPGMAATPPQL